MRRSGKFCAAIARRLLKYPCAPRERALGRMARRERGAGPLRPVTSEQRRQVAQSSLALRVDSLLALAGVARWAEIATDIGAALAPWPGPKSNSTRGAWVFQQSPRQL